MKLSLMILDLIWEASNNRVISPKNEFVFFSNSLAFRYFLIFNFMF